MPLLRALAAAPTPEAAWWPAAVGAGTPWIWIALAVLVGWLLLSILMQWGAYRAVALARREAPACFRPQAEVAPGAERIHIAFLGDLQRGVLGVVGPLGEVLARGEVDLLVSSGDFASHGEAPYYGILLDAFEQSGIRVPVRVVPGNHDLWPRRHKDDRAGGAVFERHFGSRHWHMRAGPLLLVGLDSGVPWVVETQLSWLRRVLQDHPGLPWICVCHRPPHGFAGEGRTPQVDMDGVLAILTERPPLLVVSGHEHASHDETVDGVRYVVNAHGGDVHGLDFGRRDFDLLHVEVGPGGLETCEFRRHRRRISWRVARHQLWVRLWADRRSHLGSLLAAPADLALRLFGGGVPVERHPVQRTLPDRDEVLSRHTEGSRGTE